jgi:uncharacterized integral membrane protein
VSESERESEAKAAPGEETRVQRSLRYGHRTGMYVSLAVGIAVIVFLILLIARNTREVKVDYVIDDTQTRLIWLVIISAIAGWILGITTSFLIRRRTRRQR